MAQVGKVVMQPLFNAAGHIPNPLNTGNALGGHLSFSMLGANAVKPANGAQVLAGTLDFSAPSTAAGLVPQRKG
jgi:hypothetical protein